MPVPRSPALQAALRRRIYSGLRPRYDDPQATAYRQSVRRPFDSEATIQTQLASYLLSNMFYPRLEDQMGREPVPGGPISGNFMRDLMNYYRRRRMQTGPGPYRRT